MLVLTNDSAGRTVAEAVETVVDVLGSARTLEVVVCDAGTDLDAVLDRRGDGPIVVVGGDGSLHTTVGHLWRRGEAGSAVVGLVPLGTGNDFARGCGIPLDPREAAKLIVEGAARPTDLLTDDAGGVVVNAVHVGIGADAARLARPLKRYLKIGAFPIGGLLAGFRTPGLRLRIDVDGVPVTSRRARVLMAGASNAPTIAGGTATLGPDATPDDGLLDATVSFAIGPLARIGYALRLLRGRHPGHEDVVYRQGRTLSIRGEPFFVNADGELTGPIRSRTWTVQPGSWCFIRPITDESR